MAESPAAATQPEASQTPAQSPAQAAPKAATGDFLADLRRETQEIAAEARAEANPEANPDEPTAPAETVTDDGEGSTSTEPASQPSASANPLQQIPLELRVAAQWLGATDAQIDGAGLAQVAAFVARNFPAQQAPPAKTEAPAAADPDPLADYDFGTDAASGKKLTAEDFDPSIVSVLRQQAKKLKAQDDKFAAREAADKANAERAQAQARAQAAAQIDDAFVQLSKDDPRYSEARLGSIPEAEFAIRNEVAAMALRLFGSTSREAIAKANKAHRAINGETAAAPPARNAAADAAIETRKKDWAAGALLKPSNRSGSRDRIQKTRQTTEAAVGDKLREYGIPDVDEPEINSVMFPD